MEQTAQAPDVALQSVWLLAYNLRCHVALRAYLPLHCISLRLQLVGKAKICKVSGGSDAKV